ncbi:hypothetical protein D3C78_1001560 [compost metagenome]
MAGDLHEVGQVRLADMLARPVPPMPSTFDHHRGQFPHGHHHHADIAGKVLAELMQGRFRTGLLWPFLQLGEQRQAADILQQAGEQGIVDFRQPGQFGQRGGVGGAFQGRFPAGAEDALQRRFLADEQIAHAEAQHQVVQPARAQAAEDVAQRRARAEAQQQGAFGILHEPGGQRRIAVDRAGQTLQRGMRVVQQATHAQQGLRHLRDFRFALEKAVVQSEPQGFRGE